MNNLKIFICGFMGSGKSTFTSKLGRENTFDLDQIIFEKYAGDCKTLGDYIEEKGWDNFRSKEQQELRSFCESPNENAILSLGGGTLTEAAIELINSKEEHVLIWLNTPFETCYERILGDENRPLAKRQKEELAELFKERSHFYSQARVQLAVSQQNEIKNYEDLLKFIA